MSYPCLMPEDGQPLQIQSKVFVVGRLDKCHLKIDHPSISKQHCEILIQDKVLIVDKQSLNGTFVNGVNVGKGQQFEIFSGDIIQFGKYPILYTFYSDTKMAYKQKKPNQPVKDMKISVVDFVKQKNLEFQNQQTPTIQQQSSQQIPFQQKHFSPDSILMAEKQRIDDTTQDLIKNKNIETAQQIISQLERENNDLRTQVLQQQADYDKKSQAFLDLQFRYEKLSSEFNNIQTKYQSVEPFTKDLQTKLELCRKENELRQAEIEEYKITDIGKKIAIQNSEIQQLRKILQLKDEEIQGQKKQITQLLSNVSGNPQHHIQMLEQNSRELTQLKKQLIEWESRDNECSRKWTQLLQDNARKEEQIRALKYQIDRLTQNIQSIHQEFDMKNHELNKRILQIIDAQGDQQQKEAATFLVQQISIISEERRVYLVEVEELIRSRQEIITELELLKKEEYVIPDGTNVTSLIKALRQRVEELNDILNEYKQRDSFDQLVIQKQLIEELEQKLNLADKKNKQLELQLFQLKNTSPQYQAETQFEFFTKRINELTAQIKDQQKKINQLEGVDQQKEFQIQNMKYQLNTIKLNDQQIINPILQNEFKNEKLGNEFDT
ncbi:unnamed protein product [Paramecium pentaurelia]|uniref:FHA domain-containing protein n=1 Tax=Paramecium pentaurelia TaxID=43138 RepID=A0A8S1UQ09_9CILI|nr:unnamed protein product [Paramecium pentaurelia]